MPRLCAVLTVAARGACGSHTGPRVFARLPPAGPAGTPYLVCCEYTTVASLSGQCTRADDTPRISAVLGVQCGAQWARLAHSAARVGLGRGVVVLGCEAHHDAHCAPGPTQHTHSRDSDGTHRDHWARQGVVKDMPTTRCSMALGLVACGRYSRPRSVPWVVRLRGGGRAPQGAPFVGCCRCNHESVSNQYGVTCLVLWLPAVVRCCAMCARPGLCCAGCSLCGPAKCWAAARQGCSWCARGVCVP